MRLLCSMIIMKFSNLFAVKFWKKMSQKLIPFLKKFQITMKIAGILFIISNRYLKFLMNYIDITKINLEFKEEKLKKYLSV